MKFKEIFQQNSPEKKRLAKYFHDKENPDDSLVKNKTMFVLPLDRNTALNNFVKSVENIPLTGTSTKQFTTNSNVNRKERDAIKSLNTDKNIII